MADYWKSNDRKFCDFCKCWIADNKPSIAFHENGKRHKEAVAKRITEISKTATKNEKEQQKMDIALRKMEEGARAAYAQDLCRNADISSQNHNRALAAAASAAASSSSGAVIGPSLPGTAGTPNVQDVSGTADPRGRRQVDPMALPMDPQELAELEARRLAATRSESGGVVVTGENPTLWCETVSEDGDTYYWNVKTNETVWEKPKQGYLTMDEYNNIMEQARLAQEEHAQREKQFMVENADELAAKYNREKLKQRRAEYEAKQRKVEREKEAACDKKQQKLSNKNEKERDNGNESEEKEDHSNYPAPFGQWQTVEPVKEVPYVDLQLPTQSRHEYVPVVVPAVVEEPKPKVFKEKVATLDKETIASESGVFKKRKINIQLKKNSRQRLEDY